MSSTQTLGAPGHLPGSRGYRRVMVSMFAAGLATFVLLYDTQALLPEFVEAFDVTPTHSTLTLSLTTASLAVALLVAGPISEIVGRTRLVHLSMWAATLVAFACALAPSWHALIGLRLLQGVALAGLPAVATAYLREELHHSAQARAAGLYIGGTAMGGMTGRMLTAPIAEAAGWRWAMAAAAALALVCAVIVAVSLPRSRNFVPTRASRRSVLDMLRGAMSDPALWALYLLGGCAMGCLVAVYNALGFYLTSDRFGVSLGLVSLIYLVYALGTASSIGSGQLADRIGRKRVIPIGAAVAVVGVLLTLVPSLPVIVVGMAGLTVGFFCMHGLASGWVPARAHAAGVSTSQAASCYLFAYYVGSSVFGNLGSTAWSHAGWPAVVGLAVALLAVCVVAIAALRRTPTIASARLAAAASGSGGVSEPPVISTPR